MSGEPESPGAPPTLTLPRKGGGDRKSAAPSIPTPSPLRGEGWGGGEYQAPTSSTNDQPLLSITGLTKRYGGARGVLALDGVDLSVTSGETLALVGTSGSGKTTLARLVLRLLKPEAGTIRFDGIDLLASRGRALRRVRQHLQMVFQDPLAALNPRATVGRLLADPLRVHGLVPRTGRPAAVAALLRRVGLSEEFMSRYPHELSGGQRQRINIARALATRPKLLVLDEPVSSLDVSVRAQILNLLKDLQRQDGMAYLFVSHDLAVVRAIADRVAVMAQGRIVEHGPVEAVLASPQSTFTRALVAAVPRLHIAASTQESP